MTKYYVARAKQFGDYYTGKTYTQHGEVFPVLDSLVYAKRYKSEERLQKIIDGNLASWTWQESWVIDEVEE